LKTVVLVLQWKAYQVHAITCYSQPLCWSQCIELNLVNNRPVASWTFDWLREQDGNSGDVKSYPQVYYGRKAERRVSGTFEELGLPQITNRLPEFVVDYSWSFNGNAENNVALESFFHETCEAENDNKEYEMMVWVGVPKIRTPGIFVTTATVDGKRWRVYANPFVSQGYVAFVAEQPSFSGKWVLRLFGAKVNLHCISSMFV